MKIKSEFEKTILNENPQNIVEIKYKYSNSG